jgi:hypothetical protein
MGMNVNQARQDMRSRAELARSRDSDPQSGLRFGVLNAKSQQNARTPVTMGKEHKFQMAGGGELKVKLPPGVNPNVVNDALMTAIDKAMALPQNSALRHGQVMLKNTDPKARLTKAPKTNMMISGFTLAGVADHGTTNIHYHNASGKIAGSKYGQANYTASGSNNFDQTETTGHFSMKYVGDNNSMKNSNISNYRGELAAQSTGTNIKNGDYAAKGTETSLENSSLSGRVNAMVDIAQNHTSQGPAVVVRDANFNPRKSAYEAHQAKFGALPAPTNGTIRARKVEFPQLNAA